MRRFCFTASFCQDSRCLLLTHMLMFPCATPRLMSCLPTRNSLRQDGSRCLSCRNRGDCVCHSHGSGCSQFLWEPCLWLSVSAEPRAPGCWRSVSAELKAPGCWCSVSAEPRAPGCWCSVSAEPRLSGSVSLSVRLPAGGQQRVLQVQEGLPRAGLHHAHLPRQPDVERDPDRVHP